MPVVAVLGEREMFGIARRLLLHQKFQRVPLGGHHVGQRLAAQRVFLQHRGAVLHLGNIVLVHVDEAFEGGARRTLHMGLHVHRIHVAVFIEGEGKTPDGRRAVPEGEIVAEGFLFEFNVHGFLLEIQHNFLAFQPRYTNHDLAARGLVFGFEIMVVMFQRAIAGDDAGFALAAGSAAAEEGRINARRFNRFENALVRVTSMVFFDFFNTARKGFPGGGARKRSEWRFCSGQPSCRALVRTPLIMPSGPQT